MPPLARLLRASTPTTTAARSRLALSQAPTQTARCGASSLRAFASSSPAAADAPAATTPATTTHAASTTTTTTTARSGSGSVFVPSSDEVPTSSLGAFTSVAMGDSTVPGTMAEIPAKGEERRVAQAPNRPGVWSRSQNPRGQAMVGPRFEQTVFGLQPRPAAAINLIHKQQVRWTDSRVVSCDGGGGPQGHPRIFINVDKPQICWCTYCGVPYAHKHHRKHLESLPSTSYPLEPTNDPEVVHEPQRVTPGAKMEHR